MKIWLLLILVAVVGFCNATNGTQKKTLGQTVRGLLKDKTDEGNIRKMVEILLTDKEQGLRYQRLFANKPEINLFYFVTIVEKYKKLKTDSERRDNIQSFVELYDASQSQQTSFNVGDVSTFRRALESPAATSPKIYDAIAPRLRRSLASTAFTALEKQPKPEETKKATKLSRLPKL